VTGEDEFYRFLYGPLPEQALRRPSGLTLLEAASRARLIYEEMPWLVSVFVHYLASHKGYLNQDLVLEGLRPDREEALRFLKEVDGMIKYEPDRWTVEQWLEAKPWLLHDPDGYGDARLPQFENERRRRLVYEGNEDAIEENLFFVRMIDGSALKVLKVKVMPHRAYLSEQGLELLHSAGAEPVPERELGDIRELAEREAPAPIEAAGPFWAGAGLERMRRDWARWEAKRLIGTFDPTAHPEGYAPDENLVLYGCAEVAALVRGVMSPQHVESVLWLGDLVNAWFPSEDTRAVMTQGWLRLRDSMIARLEQELVQPPKPQLSSPEIREAMQRIQGELRKVAGAYDEGRADDAIRRARLVTERLLATFAAWVGKRPISGGRFSDQLYRMRTKIEEFLGPDAYFAFLYLWQTGAQASHPAPGEPTREQAENVLALLHDLVGRVKRHVVGGGPKDHA
jgi:hypothetical protein